MGWFAREAAGLRVHPRTARTRHRQATAGASQQTDAGSAFLGDGGEKSRALIPAEGGRGIQERNCFSH
jgi:hypothetical protein